MRFPLVTAGLALMLTLAAPLRSDPLPFKPSAPAVKAALDGIIGQQIAAFQKGDFAKAYTFATREVQARYQVGIFERMVRTGFPNLVRPNSIRFGPALDNGENGAVYVRVTDARGPQLYLYSFKHEEAGWRISSVSRQVEEGTPVPPPEPARAPAPLPTPAPGMPGSGII